MSLHPVEGHEAIREALALALHSNRLPAVLLLHGPQGVGKQRLALWLGQLLVCTSPSGSGPCDECRECRLALRLEHPNLHWYFPLPKPPGGGPKDRERERLQEARHEALEEIRHTPLRPSVGEASRKPSGLHLGTIRNLLHETNRSASVRGRRLFVVADAEELVSQESATEAANALLKVLEEPPVDTWFVLTASVPGRLLPTITSRTMKLHVSPLPRDRVLSFLSRTVPHPESEVRRAADLSGGSIGRALGFLPVDGEDGILEGTRKDALRLLQAALEPRPGLRYTRALSFGAAGGRGLHELLSMLASSLRDLAVIAAGLEDHLLDRSPATVDWLRRTAERRHLHPFAVARAISRVEEARERAAGNVNPQLLMSGLLIDLNRDLLALQRERATSA